MERVPLSVLAPLRKAADDGYELTKRYGPKCETCGTQYLEFGISISWILADLTDGIIEANETYRGRHINEQ